jgi:hypothetical protein
MKALPPDMSVSPTPEFYTCILKVIPRRATLRLP